MISCVSMISCVWLERDESAMVAWVRHDRPALALNDIEVRMAHLGCERIAFGCEHRLGAAGETDLSTESPIPACDVPTSSETP